LRSALRDGLISGRIRRIDRNHYAVVQPTDAKAGAERPG
jgi:hypothetical protein